MDCGNSSGSVDVVDGRGLGVLLTVFVVDGCVVEWICVNERERQPEGMNAGAAHSSFFGVVGGGSGGGVLAGGGDCCSLGLGSSWEAGWGCNWG